MKITLLLPAALALAACGVTLPTPPPPVTVSPLPGPAQQAADELATQRASLAAAAVRAAAVANRAAPTSPAAQLTAGELAVAIANQEPPKPEDEATALARVSKGQAGDMPGAKADQAEAVKQAGTLESDFVKYRIKATLERVENAKTLAKREADWNEKFNTLSTEASKARDELADEKRNTAKRVQFWFALILRLGAAGLLLVAGLKAQAAISTGLPSMEAVKGSVATVGLAAFAFALSWAVAQWWFYYACAGLGALVFGTWAAHAYFADKAKGTLSKIGAAIDAGKAHPDAPVATVNLAELGRAMNKPEKALVKSLRDVRTVAKAKARAAVDKLAAKAGV